MQTYTLSIPTLLGTESIVAHEVHELGYDTTEVIDGRVTFTGDAEAICLANLNLRSAERVMIKLAQFKALSFEDLFQGVKAISWGDYITRRGQFPVKGYSLKSQLHSVPDCQAIVKKAIATKLGAIYGVKTLEETGSIYPVRFSIMKDVVSVYLDTTGENLYKRGYRVQTVEAPIRETLGFALIDISRWQGDRPFADPFCGSGTLPIEAAMYAKNIAPGLKRHFIFEGWDNLIGEVEFKSAKEEALDNINHDAKPIIFASDISSQAVEAAKANAKKAGVDDCIKFDVCDMRDAKLFTDKGVIVCNPPYGERLLNEAQIKPLYQAMGKKFREYPNAKKYILTAYDGFEKVYGEVADKRRKLYNGMLKCGLYQYFGKKK